MSSTVRAPRPDRIFFITVIALALVGFFIFSSASLGLLSREGARFNVVIVKQFIVLLVGLGLFLLAGRINYRTWQRLAPFLFISAVVATLLVFVPGLGFTSGGARRWIHIGAFTIQPAEFLKLGVILLLARAFSREKANVTTWQGGLGPLLGVLAVAAIVMVAQPDIDTLAIIILSALAMFFAAGARWRHLFLLVAAGLIGLTILTFTHPYIMARVQTFFNPERDLQGASYQIQQSLIAIGSGGTFGRGFGQSIQKFKYLPEPISDSIFSVASEEFGFWGATLILALFLAFLLAGLKVAARAPTLFGRLVAVGVVIMIVSGAFLNVSAMLGLIPLTGTPLIFISHGGSALLFALVGSGIVLNISRYQK